MFYSLYIDTKKGERERDWDGGEDKERGRKRESEVDR